MQLKIDFNTPASEAIKYCQRIKQYCDDAKEITKPTRKQINISGYTESI